MKQYKPKEFSEMLNVSVKTLQRWDNQFLRKMGVEIMIVNNEKLSPQEELVQDLISIIHVFSCRIYGLRKYKKKMSEDEDL
ncbi:hypothetical protein COE20_21045 [Bacillus cereus]|uniref:Transposase n=1 Tax=Bacillus cereus TaxID=1396 RepID=A0A1Q4LG94_BACCE|nr:hypothetical protein [Bacillus mobilis]OKA36757.1 transposase [Bacillus cereus]OKA41167.1 transposase [Bacillus cereus]PDZ04537.1 hypothetical protein CON03_17090 [Bacillus cereus]PFS66765.1 hypothetical protein COK41_07405 [Bacillus cereus]